MKKSISILTFLALGLMISLPVFAQTSIPQVTTGVTDMPVKSVSINWANITGFINNGLNLAATLIIAIVIIYFLYSAFMYATAGGDASKAETAKNNLIYSLIAIAIIVLAGAIYTTVENIITGK